MNGVSYSRRRNQQYINDLSFRLDVSIDKPIDDISDVSANLTRIINGVRSAVRIPYYGISFKDQRFFILFGTFSKDDEVDYKWARNFFRNYTSRLSSSTGIKTKKLFFNHQKIIPLFYKEYPNMHIAFRVVTITFTTHQINLSHNIIQSINTTLNQKQKKAKKIYYSQSFYKILEKDNFNLYNIPCFAQGNLGEGYDIQMKINGVEYDSSQYSIEVRFYLTLISFCLLLSFYAWKSLHNFISTQAHVSTVSFFSLILICAFDISICLDFSSSSSMNDCFKPPSRLYFFVFITQMTLYISMQFPTVYYIFKQQEIIQRQNIIHTLFEIVLFILICLLTHLLHVKTIKDDFSHGNLFILFFKKINRKRFFLFIISLSQFTPQIIKNLKNSQRRGINMQFIFLIGLNRFLLFLYSDSYPYNVYESENIEKDFNYYLANKLKQNDISFAKNFFKLQNVSFSSLFIFIQVLFLFCQQKLGPFFFIPKLITPKYYNYRSLRPHEGDVCLICQDIFTHDDDEETAVTPCGHAFHLNCLARWMDEKQECPTCRTPIPPINEEDYPSINHRYKKTQNEINLQINNNIDDFHTMFV